MKHTPVTDYNENDWYNYLTNEPKKQLEEILSSIGEVVWVRSASDMTLTYINGACERIYGRSSDELLGTQGILFEHIHPEDKAKLRQGIQQAFKEGKCSMEYRIFNKRGDIRYISSEGYVKKDKEGNPIVVSGTSRDVTDLRIAEKELHNKVREIENIFDSITDSFIALDKDFNFTFANKGALNLYGMQMEQLIGKNLWDLLPNGKDLKFYPELKRVIDERVSAHFEEFSPAIGKWIWINAYPTSKGLAVYFRDITEYKKMQEALRDNEYNLRALINNTGDFIWSVDKQLNIIQINQPCVDFVYYHTGQVLKPGDNMLIPGFDKTRNDKWAQYYSRALRGQTFVAVDEEMIGNKLHQREHRLKPIFAHDGEVIGVSCFSRDISEEARLNLKILNEEKKLRAIINNTGDIIWLINDHMETVSANQAYYDRVVYMAGNKKYEEITEADFAKERIKTWRNYYSRALSGETFTVIEEDHIEGRKVYEEIRFHPIHDSTNKVMSVNCMARDITAEKEQMLKVQQQNEKFNEIAAMQSHQVRGPVASILGLAQLFNTIDTNDPSNLTVLEGIKEAAAELDCIIKDVVSKTNAAKL